VAGKSQVDIRKDHGEVHNFDHQWAVGMYKAIFGIERSSKKKLTKYLPMLDKEGGSS